MLWDCAWRIYIASTDGSEHRGSVHSIIHELKCPLWQPMWSITMLEMKKNLIESVQKGVSGVRKGLMERVICALSLEIVYSNEERLLFCLQWS